MVDFLLLRVNVLVCFSKNNHINVMQGLAVHTFAWKNLLLQYILNSQERCLEIIRIFNILELSLLYKCVLRIFMLMLFFHYFKDRYHESVSTFFRALWLMLEGGLMKFLAKGATEKIVEDAGEKRSINLE